MPAKTSKSKPSPKAKAKAASPAKPAASSAAAVREKRRFWLTYPTRLITNPVIWEMSQRFPVVFNVRQASVTDEIGILCLELQGGRAELKSAITWLEKQGVKVEPVEINVIDG